MTEGPADGGGCNAQLMRTSSRTRSAGGKLLKLALAVALTCGLVGLPASAGSAALTKSGSASSRSKVWDLSADFSAAPHQANPNPDSYRHRRVWSYLSAGLDHDPTTYQRLEEFIPNRFEVDGLQGWQGDYISGGPLDKLPHVSINSTSDNPTFIVDWPPGTVLVHPAPDRAAAVAWRSPINGRISISGGVTDGGVGCGDGISWWIDSGTRTLTEGGFGDGGSQTFAAGTGAAGALHKVRVRKGQTLYFVISPGPNGDHCGDSTQLDVVIYRTRS